MVIVNETGREKIDEAIIEFHARFPEVLEALSKLPGIDMDFKYTTHTNYEVVKILKDGYASDVVIKVKGYYPRNPFTKAIAYTLGGNEIFINLRKINSFTYQDYANTIAHELCHILGYSHGNNYITPDKLFSVPYAIGKLVSGESSWPLVKEQIIEHEVVCYRNPWTLWLTKRCYKVTR